MNAQGSVADLCNPLVQRESNGSNGSGAAARLHNNTLQHPGFSWQHSASHKNSVAAQHSVAEFTDALCATRSTPAVQEEVENSLSLRPALGSDSNCTKHAALYLEHRLQALAWAAALLQPSPPPCAAAASAPSRGPWPQHCCLPPLTRCQKDSPALTARSLTPHRPPW